ncbi:carbohydrate-binding module family 50 protein [Phlebiopsis gigantea 11061_1 CR5-6]|uniref:Carbohydrate-binding module family 50 protein n=1 Tax=Phlebiopsis gigantea (strain 11061_1 CR5-6) TaxID=745531 RepID=A0A0C3S9W6_PHLG1|nr:carbohydrate-binding module family 50 protein [Phlebiopsis gigantea 11061_1 CR5-6]
MPVQASGVADTRDDASDLYSNPFAGSSSQASFSSAYTPKDAHSGTRPTLRRRGSESTARRARNDHEPWAQAQDGPAQSAVHVRSRTMDTVVGSSSGTNLHPLAVGSTTNSSQTSLADTRPRLKRLLSDLETTAAQGAGAAAESREQVSSPLRNGGLTERVVVVHQIMPKDSLAGVALKYGISLADLRKANQLWPSDPIHLRKVLYIPLDKSHKAKELVLSHLELNSTQPSDNALPTVIPTEGVMKAPMNSSETALTIRRVPASQLSFFPPPSTSSLSSSAVKSRTMPHSAYVPRRRDPIPFETVPSNSSAASLSTSVSVPSSTALTSALSIPVSSSPSGRGQIPSLSTFFSSLPLGRISFDSSASTPSQMSDDQEHEMNDVSHRNSFEDSRERRPDRQHFTPLTASVKSKNSAQQDAVELRSYAPLSTGPFPDKRPISGGLRSMPTTPTKRDKRGHYISPERNIPILSEAIRTSQLEPSPMMRLPFKPRSDSTG